MAVFMKIISDEWSFVGIREFFIDKKCLFDIKAVQTGIVEFIDKNRFMNIVRGSRSLYHKYCGYIDLVKHNRGSTEALGLHCWKCQ